MQYQGRAMAFMRFMFYSTLTLIYRVIPAPANSNVPEPLRYSQECIEAARITLTHLTEAWEEVKHDEEDYWMLFINW